MKRNIRVVIACVNANGDPDFAFVIIRIDPIPLEDGWHYNAARRWAEQHGYESPFVFFDEDDCRSFPWLLDHFVWESASIVVWSPPMVSDSTL